jgi:uncharacterized protein DUF6789
MMVIRNDILKGIVAGFAATLVLALLNLTKGVLPQLDSVTMLDGVARDLLKGAALPEIAMIGWIVFFAIGAVLCGAIFSLMEPILPGRRYWTKGLAFGFGCGLLTMLSVMPMAGAKYFGLQLSLMAPAFTLLFHLIQGATLGGTYGVLVEHQLQASTAAR